MIIWGHFGTMKFQEQQAKVPAAAPFFWWKRYAPPLEFGSMHAILFQMSLLPLTMSRLSIAAASSSFANRFIPFNRAVRFHIHLGYTMISIVFLATIFFFIFFGIICASGDQGFCKKFTSEIMITGYVILALLLTVGATSFLRDVIPYEIFYGLHHLVFCMYAVATAHTFDNVERNNERDRSQTFKWFAATLLYYFCDRAAMYINHRYQTSVAASTAVTSSKGTRMAIIKVHRPSLFTFEPGQYAFLRISDIDVHWHAFSIASGPESDYLEFYIEVYGEDSWTNRLWMMISGEDQGKSFPVAASNRKITVEVKGPYGTALGQTDEFSHAVAIGSGTGIVPIISLYKKHVRNLLRLDPETFFTEQALRNRKVQHINAIHEKNKGTLVNTLWHGIKGLNKRVKEWKQSTTETPSHGEGRRARNASVSIRASMRDLTQSTNDKERNAHLKSLKNASRLATLPIYGGVLLLFLPVLGIVMLSLTFSINNLAMENFAGIEVVVYPWHVTMLKVGTILFQALFFAVAMSVHDRTHFLTSVDVVLSIIGFLVDWYWFERDMWGVFGSSEQFYYGLIVGYMTLRIWSTAVTASDKSWRKEVSRDGLLTMDKLSFVWVTRSAHLVSEIFPDIVDIWDALCENWGEEAAKEVCDITVYVTDTDKDACAALVMEMEDSPLYQDGAIKFERPDFPQIIEDHTIDRVDDERSPHTNTLLAFCGSPHLSSVIGSAKIVNDITKFITGNKLHQMHFVSESYSASKATQKHLYPVEDDDGVASVCSQVSQVYNSDIEDAVSSSSIPRKGASGDSVSGMSQRSYRSVGSQSSRASYYI
uniref:FAD-binding FR-type domain-containing protein n=1 Tax=Ditylum brightwellii TaxID=49249 RepID=A0A7S2EV36_9STRA